MGNISNYFFRLMLFYLNLAFFSNISFRNFEDNLEIFENNLEIYEVFKKALPKFPNFGSKISKFRFKNFTIFFQKIPNFGSKLSKLSSKIFDIKKNFNFFFKIFSQILEKIFYWFFSGGNKCNIFDRLVDIFRHFPTFSDL